MAVQNAEMLSLDAMSNTPPSHLAVLTTRSANGDPAAYYRAFEYLRRVLKRRWPEIEWARLVEFTTGYGPKAGGKQRPHWNLLIKGVPDGDLGALREVVVSSWCAHVDAEPVGQYVDSIYDAGGLMKYLALHFQKEDQRPPDGWSGHRFTHTRGYFARSAASMRRAARESLDRGRDAWKARQRLGSEADPQLVELEAEAVREEREATSWELIDVWQRQGLDVIAPGASVEVRPSPASLAFRWRSWLAVGRPYAGRRRPAERTRPRPATGPNRSAAAAPRLSPRPSSYSERPTAR